MKASVSRECQQGGAFCAGSGRPGACPGEIAHSVDPFTAAWRMVPCVCSCHAAKGAGR